MSLVTWYNSRPSFSRTSRPRQTNRGLTDWYSGFWGGFSGSGGFGYGGGYGVPGSGAGSGGAVSIASASGDGDGPHGGPGTGGAGTGQGPAPGLGSDPSGPGFGYGGGFGIPGFGAGPGVGLPGDAPGGGLSWPGSGGGRRNCGPAGYFELTNPVTGRGTCICRPGAYRWSDGTCHWEEEGDDEPGGDENARELDCRRMGGTWHPPGSELGGETGWCQGPEFTIPEDAYPWSRSTSRSFNKSSSFSGPADWARPAIAALVRQAPLMASRFGSAFDELASVPAIIERQKQLLPAQILASFEPFEEYVKPVRNAYAARGMLDSSARRAAENDIRDSLYREYSRGLLTSLLGLDDQLRQHYASQAGLANQAAQTAGALASLGRVSIGQSLGESFSESYSENKLARFLALLEALLGGA